MSERSTALPPRWAESFLRLMLPGKDRESISGDLLEEYRESIVPAVGRRADRWYVRQVAGYVWRMTWGWGAFIGAILVTRYLFDSLAPVQYTAGVVHPRSAIMSDTLIATFVLAAGWQAWRSGHARSGLVVAFAAAVFGGFLSSAGVVACLAVWHDPATLRAVEGSGGVDEALWGVPLLLIPIGLVTGATGAMAARLVKSIVTAVHARSD
jgi:hypothetical protein